MNELDSIHLFSLPAGEGEILSQVGEKQRHILRRTNKT